MNFNMGHRNMGGNKREWRDCFIFMAKVTAFVLTIAAIIFILELSKSYRQNQEAIKKQQEHLEWYDRNEEDQLGLMAGMVVCKEELGLVRFFQHLSPREYFKKRIFEEEFFTPKECTILQSFMSVKILNSYGNITKIEAMRDKHLCRSIEDVEINKSFCEIIIAYVHNQQIELFREKEQKSDSY